MTNTKARSYCFTINNPTNDDMDNVIYLDCKYMIFGFEKGKKGTEHIQAYVQFDNPRYFKAVKKMLPRAHLEIAKGTPKQNIDYCSKEGDFHEFGERPTEGGRVSYDRIVAAMQDPASDPHIAHMYKNVYKMVQEKEIRERAEPTKFYVINPINDAITEIIEYFGLDDPTELTCITDMQQLSGYEDPQRVVFFSDYPEKLHQLWPRGVPIMYKFGYEMKIIKPKTFIIVTSTPGLYPFYKNI